MVPNGSSFRNSRFSDRHPSQTLNLKPERPETIRFLPSGCGESSSSTSPARLRRFGADPGKGEGLCRAYNNKGLGLIGATTIFGFRVIKFCEVSTLCFNKRGLESLFEHRLRRSEAWFPLR